MNSVNEYLRYMWFSPTGEPIGIPHETASGALMDDVRESTNQDYAAMREMGFQIKQVAIIVKDDFGG